MTTKELFESHIDKNWGRLRENEETIFEGIQLTLDLEHEFNKFKSNDLYMKVLHENSLYEKKKMLSEYFWSEIVGELYESTVKIMEETGLLEESLQSFENSYKIENTARLILENGVFEGFVQKKELIDLIINESFYPETTAEELQEGFLSSIRSTGQSAIALVVKSAQFVKAFLIGVFFLFISPGATVSKLAGADHPKTAKAMKILGAIMYGTSVAGATGVGLLTGGAGALGLGAGLAALGFAGKLYEATNSDLIKITEYLKKVNTLDNEYINDILKGAGTDSKALVKKCWEANRNQPLQPETRGALDRIVNAFANGTNGIHNWLRDPSTSDPVQIARILKDDAADPKYQKMFFDFRVCLYDKLFEIIIGYAQAIYSVDDSSYEVIRYANEVHRRKNFKAFFKLNPKEDGEVAMFKIIKLLIAIEEMIYNLHKNRADLIGDKYIDQFITKIEGQVKQAYQQLDELASQRSYNKARYDEANPSDEERAEALAKERDEQKKSIFS